jgi:G6PDH family F420-dependent oxidoreductase
MEIGYFLSSEEHSAPALVRQAQRAADAGISSVWISDHFHPWLNEQGESPFVWSVIGAIAATTPLRVSTAVTCPTMRLHPAIVAQAASTSATLLDGRFELGVGSGENLNEHIFGEQWPPTDVRLAMLEEAVELIRTLWAGDDVSYYGTYYVVENARIYSRTDTPPDVIVSGFGPKATELAARIGDGYASTSPDESLVERYREHGGRGDAQAALKVCWGPDTDKCARLAHHLWRTSGVPGELSQELRTPAHFEQASSLVTLESTAEHTPCGPDPEPIVEHATRYRDAGFDRLYLNQIGPEQDDFFDFYEKELSTLLADL